MTSAYGSDDIWAVFDDSIVTFTGPTGDSVRYGVDPNPYGEPLFGVTGWNPGVERPRPDNDAANERLRAELTRRQIHFVTAVGSSPDGTWSEPGFVLIGTDRATALQIAADFGQLAIHELTNGKLIVVKTGIPNPSER